MLLEPQDIELQVFYFSSFQQSAMAYHYETLIILYIMLVIATRANPGTATRQVIIQYHTGFTFTSGVLQIKRSQKTLKIK